MVTTFVMQILLSVLFFPGIMACYMGKVKGLHATLLRHGLHQGVVLYNSLGYTYSDRLSVLPSMNDTSW